MVMVLVDMLEHGMAIAMGKQEILNPSAQMLGPFQMRLITEESTLLELFQWQNQRCQYRRFTFFIVPSGSTPSHLDGVHTVFGKVTDGLDVITEISGVETDQSDRPLRDVTLVSVEITNDGINEEGFSLSGLFS